MDTLDNAYRFIDENLPRLAYEIMDWKHTGLLNNGTGGKLRELAELLPDGIEELRLAESMVVNRALLLLAKEN